jgi:hypothetical protein
LFGFPLAARRSSARAGSVVLPKDLLRLLAAGATGIPTLAGPQEWTLAMFEVATGKRLRTPRGHADAITAAAFTADGSALVTVSTDGTTLIQDVKGLLPAPATDGGDAVPAGRKGWNGGNGAIQES